MQDWLMNLLFVPVCIVLVLIGDGDLRHALGAAIERFAECYLFIILGCALITAVVLAYSAYRKSRNPNKTKNLRILMITACILAAAYTVLLLIL